MKKLNIKKFAGEPFAWNTYEVKNVKRDGSGNLIQAEIYATLWTLGNSIDVIYEIDADGNTSWATDSWTIEQDAKNSNKTNIHKIYSSDTSNIKGIEVHNWSHNYTATLYFHFTVIDSDNKTTYITKNSGTAVLKGNVLNDLSTYDWNNAPSVGAVRNYLESGSLVHQNDVDDIISQAVSNALLIAHPVGSIEINITGTNPSEYLGGTWESFGAGRVLIGVGTGTDINSTSQTFSSAEVTGGEYTHKLTITEIPSHTHGSKSLVGTWANWGEGSGQVSRTANGYKVTGIVSAVGDNNQYGWGTATGRDQDNTSLKIDATHEHNSVGGDGYHNNIQPYITVYFWKRTA